MLDFICMFLIYQLELNFAIEKLPVYKVKQNIRLAATLMFISDSGEEGEQALETH
jgi:hypothetical protein